MNLFKYPFLLSIGLAFSINASLKLSDNNIPDEDNPNIETIDVSLSPPCR